MQASRHSDDVERNQIQLIQIQHLQQLNRIG